MKKTKENQNNRIEKLDMKISEKNIFILYILL